MSCRHFVLLEYCINFTDNTTYNARTHINTKLNELRPMIENLNKQFSFLFTVVLDKFIPQKN